MGDVAFAILAVEGLEAPAASALRGAGLIRVELDAADVVLAGSAAEVAQARQGRPDAVVIGLGADTGADLWVPPGHDAPWLQQLVRGVGALSAERARWRQLGRDGRSVIAHDVRGVLAIVLGQCEMLEMGLRGELNPAQLRALGKVTEQARRLEGMLDELRVAWLSELDSDRD